MRRGVSLPELVVVLAVLAVVMAITLPRLVGLLDWIAADGAARDVTASIAIARNAAVMKGVRSRAVIATDSLRIDRWLGDTGDLWCAGPALPIAACRSMYRTRQSCSMQSAWVGGFRTPRSCYGGATG
jgi:prepilin-type N-terminal cleavage/methylation domain-containing protein